MLSYIYIVLIFVSVKLWNGGIANCYQNKRHQNNLQFWNTRAIRHNLEMTLEKQKENNVGLDLLNEIFLIFTTKLQICYHYSFAKLIVLVWNADNRADTVDSLTIDMMHGMWILYVGVYRVCAA